MLPGPHHHDGQHKDKHAPQDRPGLLLTIQVEPDRSANDHEQEQPGAEQIIPVGEVVGLAQLL